MNKDFTIEQIVLSLEDIIDQTNTIFEHKSKIPQIELDIVLGNIRKLYEQYSILNKINQSIDDTNTANAASPQPEKKESASPSSIINPENTESPKKASQPASIITKAEEETPEIIIESATNSKKADSQETETTNTTPEIIAIQATPSPAVKKNSNDIPSEEIISIEDLQNSENSTKSVKEKIKTDTLEIKFEDLPVKETTEEKKKNKTLPKSPLDLFTDSTPTIADKFKDTASVSLNQKITAGKEDKSFISKMQHQPIADLTKAIGINEKFLFINELFAGNMSDYTEALTHINKQCQSIDEAMNFISLLKDTYKWDENKTSTSLFYSLIERRFPAN